MSTVLSPNKGHRYTQSATVVPAALASSQNHPQNPHHMNVQAHILNYDSSEMGFPVQQPSTPPRTPRKFEQSSASKHNNSSTLETNGSKQRSRNKNRPKNVMTSPAATRNDRITPPLTDAQSAGLPTSSKPISTPSGTAFAGATFHASPAPSALPIPSFYSKSVPDSPGLKGIKALKDAASSKPETSQTPPAPTPTSSKQFQREESPLDIFFKADREEKARARSASSTQTAASASGPFQPPLASPRDTCTPPTQNRSLESPSNRGFSSAMFAMELDDPSSPGTPFGPAFSTPYSERINAARLPRSVTQPARIPQQQQQPIDRSEALKAYLFSNQPLSASAALSGRPTGASPLTPTFGPNRQNGTTVPSGSKSAGLYSRSQQLGYAFEASSTAPRTSGRSSGLRQEVTPSKTPTKTPERNLNYPQSPTPSRTKGNSSSNSNNFISSPKSLTPSSLVQNSSSGVSSGNRSADIQGMEESLRKILKLDSLGSSGIGRVNGVQSTAVPVPSVGGRPPHM